MAKRRANRCPAYEHRTARFVLRKGELKMRTEIGKRKALPAALLCFCIAAVFYLSAPTALAAAPNNVYVGGTEVTTGYAKATALPGGRVFHRQM